MSKDSVITIRFFIDGISFAHVSDCYFLENVSLHGHNVEVFLEAEGKSSFDFEKFLFSVKKDVLRVLHDLEHKSVFPQDYLVGSSDNGEYVFEIHGKEYVVPESDVLLLPGDNVSLSKIVSFFGDLCKKELGQVIASFEGIERLGLVFNFESNVVIKYLFF